MTKSILINMRVSPVEKAKIEEKAQFYKLSVSKYLLCLGLEKPFPVDLDFTDQNDVLLASQYIGMSIAKFDFTIPHFWPVIDAFSMQILDFIDLEKHPFWGDSDWSAAQFNAKLNWFDYSE